jgi:predicted metal-dependent peptidase
MATDGVSLYFNPEFVETLSSAELIGTLAHEVMHPAVQHHTRRGSRNPKRWNMACDYAINPLLVEAGLTLPKDVLLGRRFRGMSAERICNLLEAEEEKEKQNSSDDNRRRAGNRSVTMMPRQIIWATRTDQVLLRLRVTLARFWMLLSRAMAKVGR